MQRIVYNVRYSVVPFKFLTINHNIKLLGYNDIVLSDVSSITSDILWYQLNSSLLTTTLYSPVITTQNIQSLS